MKNNYRLLMMLCVLTFTSGCKPPIECPDSGPSNTTTDSSLFGVVHPNGAFRGSIQRISVKDGAVLQTLSIDTDPWYEEGLAYDGKILYYINGRTDAVGINKVIRMDFSDTQPVILDTLPTVFPPKMDALAINKKDLYVLDYEGHKIYTINLDSKTITDTITPGFVQQPIGGMTFGGNRGTIFVSSFAFNSIPTYKIYEIHAKTGAVVNTIPVAIMPFGLAYSEATHLLYMTSGDAYDTHQSVYAVDPDTKEIKLYFKGSFSALAAAESSL